MGLSISAMFKKLLPKPVEPAPPESPETSAEGIAARGAAMDEERRRRSGRGFMSTLLLGGAGDTSEANLARHMLLGE